MVGLLLAPAVRAQSEASCPVALPTDPKMKPFIDALMTRMTLEEKIGQLNLAATGFDVTGPVVNKDVRGSISQGRMGALLNPNTYAATHELQALALKTRLKIPLIFGYDVIHGYRTMFPMPLGLAATWDLSAIEQSARIAAEEAAAAGINWVYSPMVDIGRDPRWGRVVEGTGEDPYLGSRIAEAMVRGYQGPDNDMTKPARVMACLKHFALYGASEAGRDYNTTDMSRQRMFNEYLLPYQAAINAGVGSVMSSFNDINGRPATANRWLLTDLLRTQWGFQGFVATDYDAINELMAHGLGDEQQVTTLALKAGVDMDMVDEMFPKHLPGLLQSGRVTQAEIDQACRRVLEGKYRLGLFQDPYRGTSQKRATTTALKPEFLAASRDLARRSLVLLKNDKQTLPLKKSGTIALIGPLAQSQRDLIGSWSAAGDWKKAVSLEQGLRNVAGPAVKITYAKGTNLTDDRRLFEQLNSSGGQLTFDPRSAEEMIREAVQVAQQADIIVAAVGESAGMTGEATSRADLGLPGQQLALLKALKATGKPLVLVLMNGRPLTLSWEDQNADAILETWFAGSQGGSAIADVLFGAYNPAGKITMTFPRVLGQVPIYYNYKNTGRPALGDANDKYKSSYLDVPNSPLYPFGYGLSYTTFEYGKPELSTTTLKSGQGLELRVSVRNTGGYDGEEVAQLYLRDIVGSSTRPVKELKGFQKVLLKRGESQTLTFRLSPQDLKFYNDDLQFVAEPGAFQVFVGGNSRDVQHAAFTLE
ncbi:beta-glucosidase BglX [Hymenobacter bucti]|uniref:beta-glucosidase n=1 Tax=Hymenobacter bucti TaxID=1844114 RepID=A0ABW4R145_9BACT